MQADPDRPTNSISSADSGQTSLRADACFWLSLPIAIWFNAFFFDSRYGVWPWYLSPREAWMDRLEFAVLFAIPLTIGLVLAIFTGKRRRYFLLALFGAGILFSLI